MGYSDSNDDSKGEEQVKGYFDIEDETVDEGSVLWSRCWWLLLVPSRG
jgi:hypothetical protein